ncbi:MAG: MerC domain-containing protein [Bdellovibrio sp.]|nr:MerC domain-containing protein [Bdellovibrio sp.]
MLSKTKVEIRNNLWDKIAMGLASVCAIHCLLLPVVLVALPWLEGLFPHAWFHVMILGVTVPLALLAFYHGWKQHRTLSPLLWATAGVLGLTVGVVMHENFMMERIFSLAGSFFLLLGHAQNIRRCRCHHDHNQGHFCRDNHSNS